MLTELRKWCERNEIDPGLVEITPCLRPDLGDLTTNLAFIAASKLKRPPAQIAQDIAALFHNAKAENGFVNFMYSYARLERDFQITPRDALTRLKLPSERVLIDYGGPNIAKPMHVGHLRSLCIGNALYRIGKAVSSNCVSDIHYGDFGLQMGMLLAAHEKGWVNLQTASAEELASAYAKANATKEDANFLALAHTKVLALQRGEPTVVALWTRMVNTTKQSVEQDLNRLGIRFDCELGESDAASGLQTMLTLLDTRVDNGALVVGENDPPMILRNQHGGYLYGATDLSTLLLRRDFDRVLYVVDARQHFHFQQVFEVGKSLTDSTLEHIGFGTVDGPDGKPFRTRDGGVPALSELLDAAEAGVRELNPDLDEENIRKVAIGAVKFGDLQNKRTKSYAFDIERFVNPVGKSGPYLQYQAVRAGRLRDYRSMPDRHISLTSDTRALALLVTLYPAVVEKTWRTRMPHHLAQYCYDLASEFSSLYGRVEIQNNHDLRAIVSVVHEYMLHAMGLLGIPAPDRM